MGRMWPWLVLAAGGCGPEADDAPDVVETMASDTALRGVETAPDATSDRETASLETFDRETEADVPAPPDDTAPPGDTTTTDAPSDAWAPPGTDIGGVTTGTQRVLAILVDDAPGTPATSLATAKTVFADIAAKAAAMSAGRVTLDFDVVGWIDMPGAGLPDLQAMVAAARQQGADLAGVDRVLLAYAGGAGGGGSTAGRITMTFGTGADAVTIQASRSAVASFSDSPYIKATILHELGHGFGLAHADSLSSIDGNPVGYGDGLCLMGSGYASLNGDYLGLLGWIDPAAIATVTASGSYVLAPLESAAGTRVLRIPRVPAGVAPDSASSYYSLEFRTTGGFQAALPFASVAAVLVRFVRVEHAPSTYARKAFIVDATPDTPADASTDAALLVGRSFVDPETRIVVTLRAIDAAGAHLDVVLDPPAANAPPIIDGITHKVTGKNVDVTLAAHDPDGDTLSVFWRFDVVVLRDPYYQPGTFGAGLTATHVFPDTTPRRVFAVVSDGRGGETWGFVDPFGYTNAAPTVSAISASGEALIGFTFSVVASDGELLEYAWDFGDGNTSRLPRPHHLYASPGSYVVTLDVTDHAASTTRTLTVASVPKANTAPTANAGPDRTVKVGASITLDGRASVDPDAYPAPLTHAWTPAAVLSLPEGPNNHNTLTFTAPDALGTHVVTLTVSDGNLSDSDEVLVTIVP